MYTVEAVIDRSDTYSLIWQYINYILMKHMNRDREYRIGSGTDVKSILPSIVIV